MNQVEDIKRQLLSNQHTREELKRLEGIEDKEEQGYQSAPLIHRLTGAPIYTIIESIERAPSLDPENRLRDAGMLRWCREQLKGANDDE